MVQDLYGSWFLERPKDQGFLIQNNFSKDFHPPMKTYHVSLKHHIKNARPHQIEYAPLLCQKMPHSEKHIVLAGMARRPSTDLAKGGLADLAEVAALPLHCFGKGCVHS